jgi:Flp pilus assembly pilin Flp
MKSSSQEIKCDRNHSEEFFKDTHDQYILNDRGGHLRKLRSLWRKKEGASAVEYALLIGCITLAISVGVNAVGKNLSKKFTNVAQALETPGSAGTGSGIGAGTGTGTGTGHGIGPTTGGKSGKAGKAG